MSEQLLSYFTILSPEQFLICNGCKFAVSSKGATRHLIRFHKIVPGPTRRSLSQEISILILNDGGIDLIPVDPVPVIQCLDLIHGFRCLICLHITGTEGSLQCHYRKDHRDPETLSQRGIRLGMNSSFPLFLFY
jgi:hypothetical protein